MAGPPEDSLGFGQRRNGSVINGLTWRNTTNGMNATRAGFERVREAGGTGGSSRYAVAKMRVSIRVPLKK